MTRVWGLLGGSGREWQCGPEWCFCHNGAFIRRVPLETKEERRGLGVHTAREGCSRVRPGARGRPVQRSSSAFSTQANDSTEYLKISFALAAWNTVIDYSNQH